MAIGDAYSTAAVYRAVFGLNSASQDGQIATDLLAISRQIERWTDRRGTGFNRDSQAVARIFYPRGTGRANPEAENPFLGIKASRMLDVDEMAVVPTTVTVDLNRTGVFTSGTVYANPDATGVTGGDYQCLPLNRDKGPEAAPWTALYIPDWTRQVLYWPSGAMVQVLTVFGWPAVPASITDACIQLCGILRLESPRATQRIPEAMEAAFATSRRAQSIIDELKTAYTKQTVYA